MGEFEIIFVVSGIGACIVGAIQVIIAYRSATRDVEPDPERVRRFVERGMELRQKALETLLETGNRVTRSPRHSLQIIPRVERIPIDLVADTAPPRHGIVEDLDETGIVARRYQVSELMQQHVLNRPSGLRREIEVHPDDFLARITASPISSYALCRRSNMGSCRGATSPKRSVVALCSKIRGECC